LRIGFHLLLSISSAIRNVGIVLPIYVKFEVRVVVS
jgi:hypothetical protein